MSIFLKRTSFAIVIVLMTSGLGNCGGSSSSSDDDDPDKVPVNISLKNVPLSAGIPTTIIYTIPAPKDPYTRVTIDLAKTLEDANIVVTPDP